MVVDNDYAANLHLLTLQKVHINLLHNDITEMLRTYLRLLNDTKLREGSYHRYYGDIKIFVTSFIMFFSDTIDEVVKEADKCSNVMTRQKVLDLIDETCNIHRMKQEKFLKYYIPITDQDKDIYYIIVERYDAFMKEFEEFKEDAIKLDKPEKVDKFAKEHFKISVEETNKLFTYAHDFIGKKASQHLDRILISIDEIMLRLRHNLKHINEEHEDRLSRLLTELYEKNKENLTIHRDFNRCSVEIAEVNQSIQRLRDQIETSDEDISTDRLVEEVEHWTKKVEEVKEVQDILNKLNKEHEHCVKEIEIYNSLKTNDLPGHKKDCWDGIGKSYLEKKQWLEERICHAEKTTMTIFCCRGNDRVIYEDQIGQYYVDEFNHQVYVRDHYLKVFHVNCDGEFIEIREGPYYYDRAGRYILKDDEKVYRCAPCTSSYKLTGHGLMRKVTEDCGHSERRNINCRHEIKDLTDIEILPIVEPVAVRSSLDTEVVEYLWDAFGAILPDALNSVGTLKPKNPIHSLAHMLLVNKYKRTRAAIREKTKEAQEYRENVIKNRHDRAVEAALAWKATQVIRRKPEESDDLLDRIQYDQRAAQDALAVSLNYYYD